jgi:hypothetical protein
VKIEIFDVNGKLLKKEISFNNTAAGVYKLDVAKNCRTSNLLIIKAAIGNSETCFRYMPLNRGKIILNSSGEYVSSIRCLAKQAEVVDTIKATAQPVSKKQ